MQWDAVWCLLPLLLALGLDRWLGEPPNAVHPVVWMGRMLSALRRVAPKRGPVAQLLWGVLAAVSVPAVFATVAYGIELVVEPYPWVAVIVMSWLLKTTFALDGLRRAGALVQGALAQDLVRGRDALRHLCSRDPSALTQAQVVAATVESLAENTSDSVVAPLFWYALLGLPGAMAYRAVNTLDAMIGYHGATEYLGKASARLDDVLNWIPARITALLLVVSAAIHGADARRAFRVMRRDASRTESPNAGYPMAAMAGALGVQLEKVDHYVLGDAEREVTTALIPKAWSIARGAAWLFVAMLVVAMGVANVGR